MFDFLSDAVGGADGVYELGSVLNANVAQNSGLYLQLQGLPEVVATNPSVSTHYALMKARDVFKIIVATVGLLGFSYGAIYLVDGLLFSVGQFEPSHTRPGYYAARGVIEMILGILFMKGIPPFVDLAFPPGEPPADKSV